MNYWLMKSEPNTYGIDKLYAALKKTDHWEGVRNYQARNFMRDQMKRGDKAFFYHSNCDLPSIVGTMEIVQESHADFTAWDLNSKYYDPKSSPENPRWFMVKVRLLEKWKHPIALHTLKQYRELQNMILLKPGNRLSVMPITATEWDFINKLQLKPT